MKKGDNVIIASEAVCDSKLPSNEGIIEKLFTESAVGDAMDYEFAEIKFEDGSMGVVGQHEIKLK